MINKECPICSKTFSIKPSHGKKRRYCSRECMSIGYKERLKGLSNPNYKNRGHHNCVFCGNGFIHYNKSRKYCSRDCYNNQVAKGVLEKQETRQKKDDKWLAICEERRIANLLKKETKAVKELERVKRREKRLADMLQRMQRPSAPSKIKIPHKIYTCKSCGVIIFEGKRHLCDLCAEVRVTMARLWVYKNCKGCKKEFGMLYRNRIQLYCSRACWHSHKHGKKNPHYIDGRTPRNKKNQSK
jgi:hypothetical protein